MALRLPRAQSRTLLQFLIGQRACHVSSRATTGLAVCSLPQKSLYHIPRRAFSSSTFFRQEQQDAAPQTIGKVEPKLSMTFTCTVTDCGHRSTHEFTRRSYERGIVIVQCPGCMNRHLIADHLSWFTESTSDPKTIEQMIEAKGGKVKRGVSYVDGKGYETVEMLGDIEETSKSG